MIYRTEHPKPQFERENWKNLNGEWDFEFDFSVTGVERKMFVKGANFSKKIIVPFSPESKLSGIGFTDFMNCVWYRRKIQITKEQKEGKIFLHFGAVDYIANVYINGEKVGSHKGGYVSFKMDISDFVNVGENTLVVQAIDDTRCETTPSGKQAVVYQAGGCLYTRTTGIWQTVWLEFTPNTYIDSVKYYPDVDNQTLNMQAVLVGNGELKVVVDYEGKEMGATVVKASEGITYLAIPLKEKYLWEPGKGRLYNVSLTYNEDIVKSYFGLRKVGYDAMKFMFNGKSVFQRLILDQGYYPDGIVTAPSDQALQRDIYLSMDAGFNGARLHQKVFEERYLYYCDKAGYMVWGEYPSWGVDYTTMNALPNIISEWMEVIHRDFNHPSIITWCPLNETNNHRFKLTRDEMVETIYNITKALDPTRPVVDASGFYHVKTDCFDIHDYAWDVQELKRTYNPLITTGEIADLSKRIPAFRFQKYKKGLPINISEIGGRDFSLGNCFGDDYAEIVDFKEKTPMELLEMVIDYYFSNKCISGICYTQLYDIEYETNGLYTYERVPKVDIATVKRIFSKKAAIED